MESLVQGIRRLRASEAERRARVCVCKVEDSHRDTTEQCVYYIYSIACLSCTAFWGAGGGGGGGGGRGGWEPAEWLKMRSVFCCCFVLVS